MRCEVAVEEQAGLKRSSDFVFSLVPIKKSEVYGGYDGFNRIGKYQDKVQVTPAAVLRSPKRPSTNKAPTGSSGVA